MRRTALFMVCGAMIFGLTACGVGDNRPDSSLYTDQMSVTEENEKETIEIVPGQSVELFPASYTGGSELVKFDCPLEIPEAFDPQNFHVPKIMGMKYLDSDTAYENFVEGKEVTDTYHYPSEKSDVPDEDVYILSDESTIVISGIDGLNYFNPEAGVYSQVMRATEKGASQDDFDFATGDILVEQVTQTLADVSYPVNEFRFFWFSLSGEEHKRLEQDALEYGMIEEENMQGDWNGKDEYEIYAWQMYDNLPVFPQLMTTALSRAFESYQKAPVTAMFTRNGMQSLVAQLPYSFMETEEIVSFLPFSKIAAAVEEHYEKILTEQTYTVNRAKLALRVYLDEKQDLQAEPIWYFEASDNSGGVEVVLIQAETGKEIYLN